MRLIFIRFADILQIRLNARIRAQENVKQAIETMTGLSVVEVNIHVQGVGVPEEEPKEEEAARVR